MLAFLIISFIYVLLRITFKQNPDISDYQIALNLESIKAFYWYLLWFLNIPEEFKYQVVNQFLQINPIYFSYFPTFILLTYLKLIFTVLIGIILPVYLIAKRQIKINISLALFFLLWFLVLISPALLISNHTYPMYLTLSSIGLYALIAYFISLSGNKAIYILFPLIWFWFSYSTVKFTRETSYMPESQAVSRTFYEKSKNLNLKDQSNAVLLYELTNSAHIQALLDQNAVNAIYPYSHLQVYFSRKDLIENYKKGRINNKPIYIIE